MSAHKTEVVDRSALKILFDTYWTAAGWKDARSARTPKEDFSYAKEAGVMFDPIRLSHADIVTRARGAVRGLSRERIADAFVVSLSTRQLEFRSALGSFAVLRYFPIHERAGRRGACSICGEYDRPSESEDLNVLNFERYKWGGVRHDNPIYAAFDLELFRKLPRVIPKADDVAVLQRLLAAIEAAPAKTSAANLGKHLGKALESNKAERDVVVAILGFCGILSSPAHPGYLRDFVAWSDRELPARRFVDMEYPACWWNRSDGINHDALNYWFGHRL